MGDYVLWFPKGANVYTGKLRNKWFGPYRVQYLLPNNTVLLVTVDKFDSDPVIVNINKLKTYRCTEEGLPNMFSLDHRTKTQLMEESLQNENELIGKVGTHLVALVSVIQLVSNPKPVPCLDTASPNPSHQQSQELALKPPINLGLEPSQPLRQPPSFLLSHSFSSPVCTLLTHLSAQRVDRVPTAERPSAGGETDYEIDPVAQDRVFLVVAK